MPMFRLKTVCVVLAFTMALVTARTITATSVHHTKHETASASLRACPGESLPLSTAVLDGERNCLMESRPRSASAELDAPARIQTIARLLGIDPDAMLAIAWIESRFRHDAANPSSTARGAFQFIDESWLSAAALAGLTNTDRRASLDRRSDLNLSTVLAAELARDNARRFATRFGRAPTRTELYALHLLGVRGAFSLIAARDRTPQRPVSELLTANAVTNNRAFFVDRQGQPVSAVAAWQRLEDRMHAAHHAIFQLARQ